MVLVSPKISEEIDDLSTSFASLAAFILGSPRVGVLRKGYLVKGKVVVE